MANATIHLEGKSVDFTLCGRSTKEVFWTSLALGADQLDAVTCKRCRAAHDRAASKAAAAAEQTPAVAEPSCPVRSGGGFWCTEPAGEGHYRDDKGTEHHRAVSPEGRIVNWLTPKQTREGDGYGLLVARAAAAAPGRSLDTLGRLDALSDVIEQAEKLRAALVAEARAEGASWPEIGRRLGVTKQAAAKRYGEKAPAHVESGQDLLSMIADA